MTILLRNLRVPFEHDTGALAQFAADALGVEAAAIRHVDIHRRSLDCRGPLTTEYTLRLDLDDELERRLAEERPHDVVPFAPEPLDDIAPTPRHLPDAPPVVVGAGPAGLFAAWELARRGYRPLVVERGRPVADRRRDVKRFVDEGALDPESNAVFGEGGAGTFSDGKLTARSKDPLTRRVLEVLVEYGAPGDILIDARPHVGTDRLGGVIGAMRASIESMGAEVRFASRLEDIEIGDAGVQAVTVAGERIETSAVVLATGSSAEDVFDLLLRRGVRLEPRPFQMGVRIEHPQATIDKARHRRHAGHPALPPADYQVTARSKPHPVYSFCMCPGGEVMCSSHVEGRLCTNGMSYHTRAGRFANSALVYTATPDAGHPMSGIAMRRRMEQAAWAAAGGAFRAVAQRAGDLLAGRPSRGSIETSYWFETVPGDVSSYLPGEFVTSLKNALKTFDAKLRGFVGEGVLIGFEGRASCPVHCGYQRSAIETLSPSRLLFQ